MFRKQPRLVQWNDRRRSAWQPDSILRMLARLSLVLLTTLAVTGSAIWWGPPFPYRLGEIYPHDLRSRVDFQVMNHVEFVNQQDPTAPIVVDDKGDGKTPVREQAQYTER